MCSMLHCFNLAELIYDYQPICIDCADDLIERQTAIALYPEMRTLLPDLSDK